MYEVFKCNECEKFTLFELTKRGEIVSKHGTSTISDGECNSCHNRITVTLEVRYEKVQRLEEA